MSERLERMAVRSKSMSDARRSDIVGVGSEMRHFALNSQVEHSLSHYSYRSKKAVIDPSDWLDFTVSEEEKALLRKDAPLSHRLEEMEIVNVQEIPGANGAKTYLSTRTHVWQEARVDEEKPDFWEGTGMGGLGARALGGPRRSRFLGDKS